MNQHIYEQRQIKRFIDGSSKTAEFVFRLAEISLVLGAFFVLAKATDHWGAKLLAFTFALAADTWISSRLAMMVLHLSPHTLTGPFSRTTAWIVFLVLLANGVVAGTVMIIADVLADSGVLS